MATQAQTSTVHDPLRWFLAGAAATLVAAALVAGMALAVLLPPAEIGGASSLQTVSSVATQGYRDQRRGEIGADLVLVAVPAAPVLTDQRAGEIGAGSDSIAPAQALTDQRRGEINGGE